MTGFSNLGDIQVFATLSKKFKYSDIMTEYMEEQLDRQVLWLLKEIPELDFENKKFKNVGKVNEKERVKVCFETQKTSYYLILFFKHLNQMIEEVSGSDKKLEKLSKAMDDNHGCLDRDLENRF